MNDREAIKRLDKDVYKRQVLDSMLDAAEEEGYFKIPEDEE